MKIAIQGHPTRGKEVIQILESLGGKNIQELTGIYKTFYYINDKNEIFDKHKTSFLSTYKLYTLEEFEKEFPFKVGDLCIYSSDIIGEDIVVKILGMTIKDGCIIYEVGHRNITDRHSYIYRKRETLRPYKEMKKERNVTLNLEKAKEWYKKGGELKEVALQAFTEKELTKTDLPKTWEEFCNNYPVKEGESYVGACSEIHTMPLVKDGRDIEMDINVCPSNQSAKSHLAMIQLEQLRDCWRQGWKPTEHDTGYCITHYSYGYSILSFYFISFLSFPTREMAKEFLECFKDLIEQAGDLI